MEKNCILCGRKYKVSPCKSTNSKYCSVECRRKSMIKIKDNDLIEFLSCEYKSIYEVMEHFKCSKISLNVKLNRLIKDNKVKMKKLKNRNIGRDLYVYISR